ncbi:tol-pal system protein YbgF [Stutzerimonas urumqiensis]|uniref:tol-pal system protein YbgF n=1 Tax=Stutzerimonas urumqiensis TaxID=638269 RepID=UPI003BAA114D
MTPFRRACVALTLCLPALALAQAPVIESNSVGGYATPVAPPPATQGNGGAYAGGGAAAPSSAEAMLFTQLQQMQDEITELRGMIEVQKNQIEKLQQQSLERYQDLDRRLSSGASFDSSRAQAPEAGAIDASQAPTPARQSGPAAEADPAKEKLYYDAAFDLIKAKDFDKASQAFAAFLRRYPDSQYAGNAQYWLGEVNLAKGDLQAAGQAFARVSQAYPDHNKVPDSLYKLADVEQRLGNQEKSQTILREVVSRYPNSSAAQLAQRQLNR